MKMGNMKIRNISFIKRVKFIFIFLAFIVLKTYAEENQEIKINIPLESRILRTGHTAWISQNKETELITLHFIFKEAGSYYDPADKAGLSYFFSSMLSEGVKGYDTKEIATIKEQYGIELHIKAGSDQIDIDLTVPVANIKKAMELLRLTLTKPTFSKDRFMKVRDRIVCELQDALNNPSYYVASKALPAFFPHTVLANISNEQTIKNITINDLSNYLESKITSKNLLIGIAGNISDELLNGDLPYLIDNLSKDYIHERVEKVKLYSDKTIVFENNVQFNTGIIAFYSKPLPIDFNYRIKMMILNEIFGGRRFTARLMDSLRTKKGLVYGVYSSQEYDLLHHGIVSDTHISFDKLEEGLEIILEEIKKINQYGISKQELTIAKNSLIASLAYKFETDQKTAKMLADLQNYLSDISQVLEMSKKISNVTKEDLDSLSKESFKVEDFYFYIMGDKSKIKDQSLYQ
jgi:zinc protease